LGASLHEALCLVKADKHQYPAVDLHYSQSDPLATPVVVTLPENGLRLRFDGADQRLRLIEVLGFKKAKLVYKGSELVKTPSDGPIAASGPAFRRIYQLFGASYPGEYLPPKDSAAGTYVLSWPGVAFTFPLQHSAWSAEKDHVAMLGSHAASAATHMAVFEGRSWPEARRDLFVKTPSGPRLSPLATRPKDSLPSEVEVLHVHGDGRVDIFRRGPAQPVCITLNETTPQDLITELGPPDVMYRREERAVASDQNARKRTGSTSRPLSNGRHTGSQPSSYSSTGTDTFDTDFDSGETDEDPAERAGREKFWCYFSHGMDILVGPPSDDASIGVDENARTPLSASPHLVVTKVIIHGNVPGSYAFNRHRRLQWSLDLDTDQLLTSEHNFEARIKPSLLATFADTWPVSEMSAGKVVNRTWGADPSESSFFLPDAGEDLVEGGNGSEQWLGNTRLYAFPGLTFEVLENGAVSALTAS